MSSPDRSELAAKMLRYYRERPAYFDDVKQIAGDRPTEEEMILFESLVALQALTHDSQVLELGCGRCDGAPKLMQMLGGGRYHGVDASADAIAYAKDHFPDFEVRAGDVESLPYPDGMFNIVILNYVLEHTCRPDRVLDEALRVMASGSLIGMIVPVCDLPWSTPPSLGYRKGDLPFLMAYAARRWTHMLGLRYVPGYFAFPLVAEPQVLAHPELPFEPDADQVYAGSTLELVKYLESKGANVVFKAQRDVSTFIRNGRRPLVDALRTLVFLSLRASLCEMSPEQFTTTVTLVARKR